MTLVLEAEVVPFNAQVLVTTAKDAEHPQYETGAETAVWNRHAVAISTASDIDAPTVRVEVYIDEALADDGWSRVGQAVLAITDWGVTVQDVVSSTTKRVPVPPGSYEVALSVQPRSEPTQVRLELRQTDPGGLVPNDDLSVRGHCQTRHSDSA